MAKLALYLRWFIHRKVETDAGWRNIKVILSDASVPGEGEHKIMEFIRLQRAMPGYNVNTRHVIHGLDADLIMLALATHEPHFCILREEVTFQQRSGPTAEELLEAEAGETPETTLPPPKPFQFVKIWILREYLEREFLQADYTVCGGFDLERVIDDVILMCFFVGNDFLPHLPTLEIREGAIDTIFDLYRAMLPELGGYITSHGEVHIDAVQKMMKELGMLEDEILGKRMAQENRHKRQDAQKVIDITNKKICGEHLELIRKLTTDSRGEAVVLGQGRAESINTGALPGFKQPQIPAMLGSLQGGDSEHISDGHAPASKRVRLGLSAPEISERASITDQEAFKIRNRTVGGLRLLAPSANPQDAKRLHLFDKIREFASGVHGKTSLALKNLDGRERAMAHQYCDELGIKHPSKGEDPNRFILLGLADDEPGTGSVEQQKDAFDAMLKKRMHEKNDAIALTHVDRVELGRSGWKDRYYSIKFEGIDPADVAHSYMEGLVWVFHYYYSGCPSWNWFFPYHYAPFASDLRLCSGREIKFEKGTPFRPFEQLMAVFPAASGHALPEPLRPLMAESSPIGDFYPLKFKIDLNGKKRVWMAVVLLPFIEEKRLLEHVVPIEETQLTPEETARNTRVGKTLIFVHKTHPLSPMLKGAPKKESADTKEVDPPSEEAMNDVAAELFRAELSGDEGEQKRLQTELDSMRTLAQKVLSARAFPNGLPLIAPAGVNGWISGYLTASEEAPAIDDEYKAPSFYGERTSDLYVPVDFKNTVYQAVYELPESVRHSVQLLSGHTPPVRELTDTDQIIYPRFTKSMKTRGMQNVGMQMPNWHRTQLVRDQGPASRMIKHAIQQQPPQPLYNGFGSGTYDGYGGRGHTAGSGNYVNTPSYPQTVVGGNDGGYYVASETSYGGQYPPRRGEYYGAMQPAYSDDRNGNRYRSSSFNGQYHSVAQGQYHSGDGYQMGDALASYRGWPSQNAGDHIHDPLQGHPRQRY